MNDDPTRKPEPADAPTDAATYTPSVPAETSILRQTGRAALLSLAATPAPVLVAVIDWWLKTH